LAQADVVIYADSLVHPDVRALARPDAEIIASSALTLEQIWERIRDATHRGLTVARVHSGDPALYGAMHEQLVRLEAENIPYEIVPGVSSAFAAAAVLRAELTVPGLAQTVIFTRRPNRTDRPPNEDLRALARHGVTIVIFLSVASMRAVVRELTEGGYPRDTPVAVVYRVGWEEETVLRGTLETIAGQVRAAKLTRQALILVGPALDPSLRRTAAHRRSHLYSGEFSHLFRQPKARRPRRGSTPSSGGDSAPNPSPS
jgi:precorrin-4 C11-methyltransferase